MSLKSKINGARTRRQDHGKTLKIMTEGILIIVDQLKAIVSGSTKSHPRRESYIENYDCDQGSHSHIIPRIPVVDSIVQ